MTRAAKNAATTIRIAPNRSVVIDGRACGAGELVSVPTDDATTLLAEGYAVDPNALEEPRAERAERPTVYDGDGGEVQHEASGRRPHTPRAIEDGTEERGV